MPRILFCAWCFVVLVHNTSANNCTEDITSKCTDDISLLQILHKVAKRDNRAKTGEMGVHVLHGGPATKVVLDSFYADLHKDMEMLVDLKKDCEDGYEARSGLCEAVHSALPDYQDITMRLWNWVNLAEDPNFAYVHARLTTSPQGNLNDFVGGVGLYFFDKEMVDAGAQLGFTKIPWTREEFLGLTKNDFTSDLDEEEIKHAVYQQLPDLGFAFMIGIFKLPRYRQGLSSLFPDTERLIIQTRGFADVIVNGVTEWFSSLPGPMDGLFVPSPIGSMPAKLLQSGFFEVPARWVEKNGWTWLLRLRIYNRLLYPKGLDFPAGEGVLCKQRELA